MAEVDEFLDAVLPTLHKAETALHSGDVGPRFAQWSHNDPVTLFGALLSGNGWDEIGPTFERLASRFSNCESCEWDVVAAGASGDLGYIVAVEHTTTSVGGAAPESYELRSTTVFRRENGEWKVVHRHADPVPQSESARRQLARLNEETSTQ
ncbi:MAG: nuclear transport factor 2 family protein [Actinomycetota bacterium]|nr:nuclear transport factor 2 family protein [Actinomycetota bacterium]